jgi:hypothetical protein
LNLPTTLVACTAAITPYTLTAVYTPDSEGTTRVLAVTSDGVQRGETNMITDLPNSARARFDVTGNWYDPLTNGSGLGLVHTFVGSDVVFGAWYLYDSQGLPRWLSIQAGRWTSGTEYSALLYETRALGVCPAGATSCPLRATTAVVVGNFVLTVSGKDTAVAEARSLNGTVLFSSNLVRVGL